MGPTCRIVLSAILFAIGSPPSAAEEAPAIRVPGDVAPAVLEQVQPREGLTAVAVDGAGARAAASWQADEPGRAVLRIFGPDTADPRSLEVQGRVRDLLFAEDGSRVYGILHRSAKRRPGVTTLIELDVASGRLERPVRLPTSAAGLDHWPAEDALLVACRNEIRTFRLPDMRSAPLYRLGGDNLDVAVLGGSRWIVIARSDEVVLMNLDDPPGRPDMPVRERVALPAPAVAVAADADGDAALLRLADGSLRAVSFGPLRVTGQGRATAIAALHRGSGLPSFLSSAVAAPRRAGEPAPAASPQAEPAPGAAPPAAPPVNPPGAEPPQAEPPQAEPKQAEPKQAEPKQAEPKQAEPKQAEPKQAEPKQAEPKQAEPKRAQPVPATPPQPAPLQAAPVEAPSPEASARPSAPVRVAEPTLAAPAAPDVRARGRVEGSDAFTGVAVVLLGPDNLLREAARIPLGTDGSWAARDLAPGRYRVQLDGGGRRVVVSEPAFATITVEPSGTVEVAPFRVLGIR